ncbi:SDR family oxidoreductase [Jannaschia formosa]|uniref:SDR family oxidoreductase n=1 Tax=Jannaschia formosa TaxID=2259592 RepID=UPI000E1C3009|nr:SDR family oxidoreductase [Jannaschia formosa]TFL16103.1 SDR family NAD(P)-dependent oxidoreductase [Jannaschia formosa]
MSDTKKIAVVAGGSAGVGRAVVDALVDRGYKVAVLARGKSRLDQLQAHHGADVWTRTANVAEQAQVDAAADAIVAELGAPSVWVNSAMLTSFSRFEDVDEAEFRKITDTTYLGTVNGCRAALRIMSKGSIVNVGSGLAYTSVPYQAAYCGAKHAIEGFTQALRIELARDARPINLSMVQLPAMNTPQFDWTRNRMDRKPQPAPPIFQPEVAAKAVLKAIDERSREVLVGRSVLKLMSANFALPDVVEAKLAKMGVEAQKSDQPDNMAGDNLDGPYEDYPSRAHGSYDDRAEESGVIVDGDVARKTALIGGALALLALGWGFGRATKDTAGTSDGGAFQTTRHHRVARDTGDRAAFRS